MRALVWDGGLYLKGVAKPMRQAGEVLLKTVMAGICNTDLEITRGYVPGFRGILGHEFVAYVEDADDTTLAGKRVTGSINIACGHCDMCRRGMEKHCLERHVLGIRHKDGAFAEFLTLPAGNIVEIPRSMADDHAVFLEPLAAALEILHQTAIGRDHSVLLIGDGKLGLLAAFVLATTNCNLTVLGRHENKLRVLNDSGIDTLFEGGSRWLSF
jgi:threonine dehydrogenase-like Zn-dependent dehydrogenase